MGGMKLLMAVALLALVQTPARAEDKEAPIRFTVSRDQVFAAAMVAVAKHADRIDQANQESGFISYMAWYSKMFGGRFPVSVSLVSEDGGKATRLLVVCPKSEVRKKAVRLIADELVQQGLISKAEIPKGF
jgi:hypothetical protein